MSKAIEGIYFSLAESYDAVPVGKRGLYLARLALLLTNEIGDAERVKESIATVYYTLGISQAS